MEARAREDPIQRRAGGGPLPRRAVGPDPDVVVLQNGQIVETRKTDSGIGSMFRISDIVGSVPEPMSDDAAWRIGHAGLERLGERPSVVCKLRETLYKRLETMGIRVRCVR